MTRIVPAAMLAAFSLFLAGAAPAAVDPAIHGRLAALAVPFVPNAGQWDGRAAFAAHLSAGVLFVTAEGQLVYRLPGKPQPETSPGDAGTRPGQRALAARTPGWVLTETLVDGEGQALAARPHGDRALAGTVSYALGNDESRHRDGLPTFERVSLGEVYPGIAVNLRATGNNVEKIFTVAPARDPRAIRIRLAGAEGLALGGDGALIAQTGNGPVVYTPPIAYQEDAAGRRSAVPVRYALDGASASYGFAVGAYDASRPLVIDPLLQSTYLGGNGNDVANALAIHPVTGQVYVAGATSSTDLPKAAGAEQTTNAAGVPLTSSDAFVTRLDATLTTRLQSTYLGGTSEDVATALAIDPATGDVYVAGYTSSANFPKTSGAEQATHAADTGARDAFVTRLDAALTTRKQSTYLGGTGDDRATALAIHPATGEVYVAGDTTSPDFPKVAGAEQTTRASGADVFVTRLNRLLTARLQSIYLGGNGTDAATALAIHPATGEVYVAGYTGSTDFPKVAGAEQSTHAVDTGNADAFVTRLNTLLTTRLQSTYLGGNATDLAFALAIHPATGEVYVAGSTTSTDFPKVAGAGQIAKGASSDAFVTRLNAGLTTRLQSTYLGGNSSDQVNALAIHPATGDVFVAGYTGSTDFPKRAGAEQATHSADGGVYDAFVTRFNAALTIGLQSTYLGGNWGDQANALAIHPVTGDVYVAGSTGSSDFPKVAGSEQTNHANAGDDDAFVSRYSVDLMGADVVPGGFSFAPRLNVPIGSQQTAGPAQITGIVGSVPISLRGGNFAQYCVSASPECLCDVTDGWVVAASALFNSQYVCVRQNAPFSSPGRSEATVVVGGGWANFAVTTGLPAGTCVLDIDGNGGIDALTDGLLMLRAMFGLTGTAVTNAAVGANAARNTWAQIQPYLNGNCGTNFAP